MGFNIGSALSALASPITLPLQIAQSVAPAATSVLRSIAANSTFVAGQAAAGTAAMMGMPLLSPLISMGSSALASSISGMPQGLSLPDIMTRAAMTGGFSGAMSPMMYSQIGAPYMQQQIGGSLSSVGQYATGGMPTTFATSGYNNINSTSAAATANAGFMPSGNNGLDLANSIANAPAYSPAEQSLLNQIQDPQQRAMQQLQMFMQKQALLATMLSNLANMRHEMLKTVANNLRA